MTLHEIGRFLQYRDHSSAIHLRDRFAEEMEVDSTLRQEMEFLNNQL